MDELFWSISWSTMLAPDLAMIPDRSVFLCSPTGNAQIISGNSLFVPGEELFTRKELVGVMQRGGGEEVCYYSKQGQQPRSKRSHKSAFGD